MKRYFISLTPDNSKGIVSGQRSRIKDLEYNAGQKYMKSVAILQSNYIPWKGYFDLINMVDEFIIYDDVQYTRRDWRNRNKIKTPNGNSWLTIPVESKGRYTEKINEIKVASSSWGQKHWLTITHNYSKSRYYKDYKDVFEPLYLGMNESYLSAINVNFLKTINNILGIKTIISFSPDYGGLGLVKTERLVHICKAAHATEYLSGPAAKDYIVEEDFKKEKIRLKWMDYSGYCEYSQQYPPFDHFVSIIDLIFNEGPNARGYMKSFREVL